MWDIGRPPTDSLREGLDDDLATHDGLHRQLVAVEQAHPDEWVDVQQRPRRRGVERHPPHVQGIRLNHPIFAWEERPPMAADCMPL